MTVEELIKELQKLEPDKKVYSLDVGGYFSELTVVQDSAGDVILASIDDLQ